MDGWLHDDAETGIWLIPRVDHQKKQKERRSVRPGEAGAQLSFPCWMMIVAVTATKNIGSFPINAIGVRGSPTRSNQKNKPRGASFPRGLPFRSCDGERIGRLKRYRDRKMPAEVRSNGNKKAADSLGICLAALSGIPAIASACLHQQSSAPQAGPLQWESSSMAEYWQRARPPATRRGIENSCRRIVAIPRRSRVRKSEGTESNVGTSPGSCDRPL